MNTNIVEITNREEIKKAQRVLEKELEKIADKKGIPVTIVYQGESGDKRCVDYISNPNYHMWFYLGEIIEDGSDKCRYWNAFGIEEPLPNTKISSIVEINIPFEDPKAQQAAGRFAKDSDGNLFLVHRGIIWTKKGVTKEDFFQYCKDRGLEIVSVATETEPKNAILIGNITSPNFPEKLSKFLHVVKDFKDEHESK